MLPRIGMVGARLGGAAPRAAQLLPRRNGSAPAGPNPFLVVGVALVVGIAIARVIDWRGHAHPRG